MVAIVRGSPAGSRPNYLPHAQDLFGSARRDAGKPFNTNPIVDGDRAGRSPGMRPSGRRTGERSPDSALNLPPAIAHVEGTYGETEDRPMTVYPPSPTHRYRNAWNGQPADIGAPWPVDEPLTRLPWRRPCSLRKSGAIDWSGLSARDGVCRRKVSPRSPDPSAH